MGFSSFRRDRLVENLFSSQEYTICKSLVPVGPSSNDFYRSREWPLGKGSDYFNGHVCLQPWQFHNKVGGEKSLFNRTSNPLELFSCARG